jgi:hypothetical protein
VVGAIPHYRVGSLYGEAAQCYVEFPANGVVEVDPVTNHPRLVREGEFTGTCDGKPSNQLFESVKVASVSIQVVAWGSKDEKLTLDAARPDSGVSLRAFASDACGHGLDPGFLALASDTLLGNARWKLSAGCEQVVTPQLYEWQTRGVGFERPSEEIRLGPIAKGTCTVEVDYFGARDQVTVTVR